MQILLKTNVEHLGRLGDVVAVKPGYARNYLLPKQKAALASERNKRELEHQQREAGKKREKIHDDLQLAAQAMCQEEMTGKIITHGASYHHGSRRRREVAITQELRDKVEEDVNAIRAMMHSGKLPPPVNDARCKECSLKDIGQPDALAERHRLKSLREELFNMVE